jgi:hypothetical protein
MKLSAACVLLAVGGASAYSTTSRRDLRNLGQKTLPAGSRRQVGASMKMEGESLRPSPRPSLLLIRSLTLPFSFFGPDFGLFKGTGIGFDDLWEGNEAISEVGIEKRLNQDGLRYRLNRTEKEASELEPLLGLPGFTVNLPIIGETYLGPPRVESIWEAIGFTATSNNEARQQEKLKAIEKARNAKKGVLNGPGAEIRSKWLDKYGYPRLVGSGGIFYADQLSSDKVPMGGFNMGKSGQIWPIPDVVKKGAYGGEKGWGMKKKGPSVDNLKKVDKI